MPSKQTSNLHFFSDSNLTRTSKMINASYSMLVYFNRYFEFENGKHNIHLRYADEFNDIVSKFLLNNWFIGICVLVIRNTQWRWLLFYSILHHEQFRTTISICCLVVNLLCYFIIRLFIKSESVKIKPDHICLCSKE